MTTTHRINNLCGGENELLKLQSLRMWVGCSFEVPFFIDDDPLPITQQGMGSTERGREDGSKEGGVFDGRENTEIGEGANDEEKDDGFDWVVNSAPREG